VEGLIEVVGEETSSSSELDSAKTSFPIFCFNKRRKWHRSYSENFVQCFKQHPCKASLQSGVEAQYNSLASHQCMIQRKIADHNLLHHSRPSEKWKATYFSILPNILKCNMKIELL
jgi:hypothetical protein